MTNQPSIKEYRATSARQQSDETSYRAPQQQYWLLRLTCLLTWNFPSDYSTLYEYELLHFIRLSFASQCGMGALSVPALCRPNCHDTDPPCTMPITSRPSWRSMIGRHGTRVNSWDFRPRRILPLDRCTVPVNLPLTLSPSSWRRGTAGPYLKAISDPDAGYSRPAGWREGCAGRRGCPGCGWRRPVRYGARGAGPWLRGLVARSRLAQGRPSRRGSAAGPARSRRPIRSVCSDRPGKDANAGLTVSAGVMGGGTADQIIGDAPLVGVDPLDDTGPA